MSRKKKITTLVTFCSVCLERNVLKFNFPPRKRPCTYNLNSCCYTPEKVKKSSEECFSCLKARQRDLEMNNTHLPSSNHSHQLEGTRTVEFINYFYTSLNPSPLISYSLVSPSPRSTNKTISCCQNSLALTLT